MKCKLCGHRKNQHWFTKCGASNCQCEGFKNQ